MNNLLAIFIGGGIGASLRFLVSFYAYKKLGLTYWATFLINILGCFFLGVVTAFFMANSHINKHLYLFLTTGIAGGFTTFSTFSYESFELIREGKILNSFTYVAFSVLIGLVSVYLGFSLFKFL